MVQLHENQPSYFPICDDDFKPLHGYVNYECSSQEWSPALRCIAESEENHSTTVSIHQYGNPYKPHHHHESFTVTP